MFCINKDNFCAKSLNCLFGEIIKGTERQSSNSFLFCVFRDSDLFRDYLCNDGTNQTASRQVPYRALKISGTSNRV